MPGSRRARGRLREVAAFPAETRKKANNGSRPALCEPRQAEGAQPGMAKFKAGQGAGRAGMLMGAAEAQSRGGRRLCMPLPCTGVSTRKPPH